ncbi:MAG: DUF5309 domain-containing protein [Rhodospirillales bacterium]
MTQPSNTFATNDMVGIREDLAEIIYNISPVETPFFSMVPRAEVSNTNHEWQTDTLAAAGNNAVIEGDDATTDAATATTRLGNRTQISDKVPRVTGTARAVTTAGRADEFDYQLLKAGRELRRDVETVLLSNKAKVTGDDTTAAELAGVPAWIATNVSAATDGSDPAGTGADARSDGTQRDFIEDHLKEVLRECYDAGGMPDTLMLGSFNRQRFSGFSPNTNFQRAEDSVLHATFDVYMSDYGSLKVVPNRFQRGRDGLVLQSDMWAVGFLPGREFIEQPLAKTGDTDRTQILAEYTLEARQEAANGIVADLTTS